MGLKQLLASELLSALLRGQIGVCGHCGWMQEIRPGFRPECRAPPVESVHQLWFSLYPKNLPVSPSIHLPGLMVSIFDIPTAQPRADGKQRYPNGSSQPPRSDPRPARLVVSLLSSDRLSSLIESLSIASLRRRCACFVSPIPRG